jgi:CheY-like chemotaxis protein
MLKKSGFNSVEMAESGEEALERLETLTPDAIFVDFLMDGIDGLETIKRIRADSRFGMTPIVMCTANEGDEYVNAAIDHGALGILVKPPTDESLGEIVAIIEQQLQEEAEKPAVAEVVVEEVPEAVVSTGLSEEEVRKIAEQAGARQAEQSARQAVEQTLEAALDKVFETRLEAALSTYLDERLESQVIERVRQEVAAISPPRIDTDGIQERVVDRVNRDLEDFVRQLTQREVGERIQTQVDGRVSELSEDFSQRLEKQESKILEQVPEKNDMIEHIRVVTEGSLEAQVHETASQVANDIANSVATETVEQLLEQHLAQQAMEESPHSGNKVIWGMLVLLLLAFAGGAYFLL